MKKRTLIATIAGVSTALSAISSIMAVFKARHGHKGKTSDKEMIKQTAIALSGEVLFGVEAEYIDGSYGIPVNVVYNPYMVTLSGASVAIASLYDNTVIVDATFMRMNDITKRFIIGHELGHMHYEHTGIHLIKRLLEPVMGKVNDSELAADEYAVYSMYGEQPRPEDYLEASKALMELRNNVSGTLARKELLIRARVWEDKWARTR